MSDPYYQECPQCGKTVSQGELWQKCPYCKGNPIYTKEVPAEEHPHHKGLFGRFFKTPIPFPHTDIDWQCGCGVSGHATRKEGAIVSMMMAVPR